MNIYYKQFLSHSEKKNSSGSSRTNAYFSVGPTYQRFNLVNVERIPVEFTENGIKYVRFEDNDIVTIVNKFGGNINLGLQFAFGKFLFDVYGGVGFRYSVDAEGNNFEQDSGYWVSFGYSGFLFDGGLRLGYYFL